MTDKFLFSLNQKSGHTLNSKPEISMQAWIGHCYLIRGEESGEPEQFETFVVAYCKSKKEFTDLVEKHVVEQDYRVRWFEEVNTAINWLRIHGHNNEIITLTQSVSLTNRISMSPLRAMNVKTKAAEMTQDYLTITEHDIPPFQDPPDIPSWELKWIAPELKNLLFAQNKEQPLNTYLIVDAGLRKQVSGHFDLDSDFIDQPMRCLFKGSAESKLKNAAPYLIDMTLPEDALENLEKVPHFHRDFFATYWGKGTGIFIRTTATFEDIWQHYRKFTYVCDKQDKWCYFRFYDPQIMRPYAEQIIAKSQDRADAFLFPGEQGRIELLCYEMDKGKIAVAQNTCTAASNRQVSFRLDEREERIFEQAQQERLKKELLTLYSNQHPVRFRSLKETHKTRFVEHVCTAALNHNIKRPQDIAYFGHLMLYLGAYWYEDPIYHFLSQPLEMKRYLVDRRMDQIAHRFRQTMPDILGKDLSHSADMAKQMFNWYRSRAKHQISIDEVAHQIIRVAQPYFKNRVEEADFRTHIHQSRDYAKATYGVSETYDKGVWVACSLLLGIGFDRDPLTPWAGEILADDSIPTSIRIEQLLAMLEKRATKILNIPADSSQTNSGGNYV